MEQAGLGEAETGREEAITEEDRKMQSKKTSGLLKKYGVELKPMSKKEIISEQKEIISELKKHIKNRKFKLKKWARPKDNPEWSHDHCEICLKEISNMKNAENKA